MAAPLHTIAAVLRITDLTWALNAHMRAVWLKTHTARTCRHLHDQSKHSVSFGDRGVNMWCKCEFCVQGDAEVTYLLTSPQGVAVYGVDNGRGAECEGNEIALCWVEIESPGSIPITEVIQV